MRYAVYFCPAEASGLDCFGREWLATTSIPGIGEERWQTLLSDVRRYGWHATLWAPSALAEGIDEASFQERVARIARSSAPFDLPLRIDWLAGFLALRPVNESSDVSALAERCVRDLNALRAPLTDAAWSRRVEGLNETERGYFRSFGYPYVLDRFRFHMTLSAPATVDEEQAMRMWLSPMLGEHTVARIDALTLCRERAPGQPFEKMVRIALGEGRAA
jgi:2'-5' RNA ligase